MRCTCHTCRVHDATATEDARNQLLLALEKLARRPSRRGDPVARAAIVRHVTVQEAGRGVMAWLRRVK